MIIKAQYGDELFVADTIHPLTKVIEIQATEYGLGTDQYQVDLDLSVEEATQLRDHLNKLLGDVRHRSGGVYLD